MKDQYVLVYKYRISKYKLLRDVFNKLDIRLPTL